MNIMLDLETMSTESNAAITGIGAVEFDTRGLGKEFYCVVDLQSSMDMGCHVSADTIKWWISQPAKARRMYEKDGYKLPVALQNLSNWILEDDAAQHTKLWGNGAAFDNVILANAFKVCGLMVPWMFWNDFCFRTAKLMVPNIQVEFKGTKHHALHDAKNQALFLIEIIKWQEKINQHKVLL